MEAICTPHSLLHPCSILNVHVLLTEFSVPKPIAAPFLSAEKPKQACQTRGQRACESLAGSLTCLHKNSHPSLQLDPTGSDPPRRPPFLLPHI